MLPILLGGLAKSAGSSVAKSALSGIGKALVPGSDPDEKKKDSEVPKEETTTTTTTTGDKIADSVSSQRNKEDDTKRDISKSLFERSGNIEKDASVAAITPVGDSNDILQEISSTLTEMLALQKDVSEPDSADLREKFTGRFEKKEDTVGKKLAGSTNKTTTTTEKGKSEGGMGLGMMAALGIGGIGALSSFGYQNTEGSMSDKVAGGLGDAAQRLSFGMLDGKEVTAKIQAFFKTITEGFNKGLQFLQDMFGVKLIDEGEGNIFQKLGAGIKNSIQAAYTAITESEIYKNLKEMFTGIIDLDADVTKSGFNKLKKSIMDGFESMMDSLVSGIFDSLGRITIPQDAMFFGGRSLGSLMGGKATSKLDIAKEELDTFDERNKGAFGLKRTMSATRKMLDDKVKAAEKGKDYQVSEGLQKEIDKENKYREEKGLPPLIPQEATPNTDSVNPDNPNSDLSKMKVVRTFESMKFGEKGFNLAKPENASNQPQPPVNISTQNTNINKGTTLAVAKSGPRLNNTDTAFLNSVMKTMPG